MDNQTLFDLMHELAAEIANNPDDWGDWVIVLSHSNSPLARQICQWLLAQVGTTVVPQQKERHHARNSHF